jgi:hypothetical protein
MDQRDKQIIAEAIDESVLTKDVIIRTLNEQVDWQIASVLDDISSIECIYGCLDKVDRGSMQFKVSVQGRGPKPALFRLILKLPQDRVRLAQLVKARHFHLLACGNT